MSDCHRVLSRVLLFALVLLLVPSAPADDKERVAVGKHVSATGMLLAREAGKAWQVVKQGADVFSGDMLVGLPGAVIDSKNGGARLTLLSDLDGTSPFPVLEAAVVLHASTANDLDFTLDRGRVELGNRKAKGTAKVGARVRKETWELTLGEAGSRIGLEMYGRWPKGIFFSKDGKEEPTAELVLIVLKGSVDVKLGTRQLGMSAPPGPAYFHWDSGAGADAGPQRLEKLPIWADPDAKPSPDAKERAARLEKFQKELAGKAPEAVIAGLLKSKNAGDLRVGAIALGATDNLAGLHDALNSTDSAELRDNAVMALRHWIGRKASQDLALYNLLVNEKKYPPAQAMIVLRLLHSFGEADTGRPETYEALIAYLTHDRLAIRELARWQLYRLVPATKDVPSTMKAIPYDAAAPVKDREAAQEKWRKLVPEGKLPTK
jgi:hypothetical protein